MSDAVALLDGGGRVVRCNAATLEVTGLYMSDIVGRRCDRMFNGAGAGSSHQQAFETGQAQSKIIERGGKWLRLSCRPQLDASGHVKGGVLVVSDISPLHRAEQAASEHAPISSSSCSRPSGARLLPGRLSSHCGLQPGLLGLVRAGRRRAHRRDGVRRRPPRWPSASMPWTRTYSPDRAALSSSRRSYRAPGGTSRYTLSHKARVLRCLGHPGGHSGCDPRHRPIRAAELELARSAGMLGATLEGAVSALGATTELRDPYTAGHQRRVAGFLAIAVKLGWDGARTELLDTAARYATSARSSCRPNPGQARPAERRRDADHPPALRRRCRDIVGSIGFHPDVAKMIRQHHERPDGSGYPDGLAGAEILAETLVLSVADVVEAMISHRPYRPGLPIEAAVAELRAGTGHRYEASTCEAAIALISAEGFKLGSSIIF